MKKTVIISVLLLSAATLSFGQNFYGRQGEEYQGMNRSPARQNFMRPGSGSGGVAELVELKGKISLEENSFPSIKTGKEDLDLIIGPAAVETLKLKSGDNITVKGFKVPGPNWSVDEKSALKVREITVNDKTYLVMGGSGMHNPADCDCRGPENSRGNRNFPGDNNFGRKGNR